MREPACQVLSVATLLDIEWIVPEPCFKRQICTEEIPNSHFMAMIGYCSFNGVSQRDNNLRVRCISQDSLRHIRVNEIRRGDFSQDSTLCILWKLVLVPLITAPEVVRKEIDFLSITQCDFGMISQDIVKPSRCTLLDTDSHEEFLVHSQYRTITNIKVAPRLPASAARVMAEIVGEINLLPRHRYAFREGARTTRRTDVRS